MQRARTVVAAAVLLTVGVAGSSSAQVPGINLPQLQTPQVQLPSVQVPSVQTPQVQVPSVETPPVRTPPVRVPQTPVTPPVEVPSVNVPKVNTPSVNAPSVTTPSVRTPEVRAPAVSAPRTPSAPNASDALPRTVTGGNARADAGTTSAGAGSGGPSAAGLPAAAGATGTPGGTTGSTPANARARQVALVRRGSGVLGTRFRSRSTLVRTLSECVGALPSRQQQLLTLRYGVGGGATLPAGKVAERLGLSAGQYAQVRRRAFNGLIRSARSGGCEATGAGAAGPSGATAPSPGENATDEPASVSQRPAVGVLGNEASGGSGEKLDDDGFLGLPSAIADALEDGGPLNATLAALILAAALALLAGAASRPVLAAARRRGAVTYGQELSERDERYFEQFNSRVETARHAEAARSPRAEASARAAGERRKAG
jgi:hypothetical protein